MVEEDAPPTEPHCLLNSILLMKRDALFHLVAPLPLQGRVGDSPRTYGPPQQQEREDSGCILFGCIRFRLIQVEGPTLTLDDTIPWAGALDCLKRKRL